MMLLQVTATYNGTCIILFTYPLEAMWDGNLSLNQTTYYLQYMTSLYVETQKQGMSNIFLLQIDGIDFPTTGWCSGHPNVAAHENMSHQLSTYIQAVLPAWGNTMFHRVYTTVETGVWTGQSHLELSYQAAYQLLKVTVVTCHLRAGYCHSICGSLAQLIISAQRILYVNLYFVPGQLEYMYMSAAIQASTDGLS